MSFAGSSRDTVIIKWPEERVRRSRRQAPGNTTAAADAAALCFRTNRLAALRTFTPPRVDRAFEVVAACNAVAGLGAVADATVEPEGGENGGEEDGEPIRQHHTVTAGLGGATGH